MRRVVQSSKGPLALDVTYFLGHVEVSARTFDDAGWEQTDAAWKEEKGPLAGYLAATFGLAGDEAALIARETLEQWEARGGRAQDKIGTRGVLTVIGFFLLPALFAAAIVAVIVLLVR